MKKEWWKKWWKVGRFWVCFLRHPLPPSPLQQWPCADLGVLPPPRKPGRPSPKCLPQKVTITYDMKARQAMLRGINTVADAVGLTIGPRGRNVMTKEAWAWGGAAVASRQSYLLFFWLNHFSPPSTVCQLKMPGRRVGLTYLCSSKPFWHFFCDFGSVPLYVHFTPQNYRWWQSASDVCQWDRQVFHLCGTLPNQLRSFCPYRQHVYVHEFVCLWVCVRVWNECSWVFAQYHGALLKHIPAGISSFLKSGKKEVFNIFISRIFWNFHFGVFWGLSVTTCMKFYVM